MGAFERGGQWYRVQVQKILDLRALGVYLTTCIIIILDMKGGGVDPL